MIGGARFTPNVTRNAAVGTVRATGIDPPGGRRVVRRRLIAHIARHADVIARERISPDVSGLASIRSVLAVDIDSG